MLVGGLGGSRRSVGRSYAWMMVVAATIIAISIPVQGYSAWFGEVPAPGINPTYHGNPAPDRNVTDDFSSRAWQQSMTGKWQYSAWGKYSPAQYHTAPQALALGFSSGYSDGTDYGSVIEARDFSTTAFGSMTLSFYVTSYAHDKKSWDSMDAGLRIRLYSSGTPANNFATYTYWFAAWYQGQNTKTPPSCTINPIACTKLIGSGQPVLNTWSTVQLDPTSDFNIDGTRFGWSNTARVRVELYVAAVGTSGDSFEIYFDDLAANVPQNAMVVGNGFGGVGSVAQVDMSAEVYSAVDNPYNGGHSKMFTISLAGLANTRVNHGSYTLQYMPYWNDISSSGIDTGITGDDQGTWIDLFPAFLPSIPFRLYGQPFDMIYVCSNGWAAFADPAPIDSGYTPCQATPAPLPNPETVDTPGPSGVLAPLWRDFDLTKGGKILYRCTVTGCTIEWYHVRTKFSQTQNDFEIFLDGMSGISFGYNKIAPKDSEEPSPTIGISDATGTLGSMLDFSVIQTNKGAFLFDPSDKYLDAVAFEIEKKTSDISYGEWDVAQIGGYNIYSDSQATRHDPDMTKFYLEVGKFAFDFACVFAGVAIGLACLAVDYGVPIVVDWLVDILSKASPPPDGACGSNQENLQTPMEPDSQKGCFKLQVVNDAGYSVNGGVDAALAETLYWVVPTDDGLPHVLQISFVADVVDHNGVHQIISTQVVLGVDTQGNTFFSDDFEKNPWTPGTQPADVNWLYWKTDGLWHMTDMRGHSVNRGDSYHSAYYGLVGSNDYYTGGRNYGAMVSPLLNVQGATDSVYFWSYWSTRSGLAVDQKLVQVSTDGLTWTTLIAISEASEPFETWSYLAASLHDYVGKTIQVRFYFDTVDSGPGPGQYQGWFIDDVGVRPLPISSMAALPTYETSTSFGLDWGPAPGSSSIATYTIQYSFLNTGWVNLQGSVDTTATHTTFTGFNGLTYSFRSVAKDPLGNIESKVGGDTVTTIAATPPSSIFYPLPAYETSLTFPISWSPAPGTNDIATYTIQYTDNNGPWYSLPGYVDTTATSGTFTGLDGHTYGLRSIAKDLDGLVESKLGADTWTTVDVTPPSSIFYPLPAYETSLTFPISWFSAPGTNDIATYTIQFTDNNGPWTNLLGYVDTTATSGTFTGLDGHTYGLRSIAKDFAGYVEVKSGSDTGTIVDVTPPQSAVATLPAYEASTSFWISWGPKPGTTDIKTYSIQYTDNDGPWTPVATDVTYTTIPFTEGRDGHRYAFRSIARDLAGNVETKSGNDTWTIVDTTPPHSFMSGLAPYTGGLSVSLSWGPGSNDIATYTIQYTDNNGPWTNLPGYVDTTATSATFTGQDGHRYGFRSVATDRAGNVESKSGEDTWTILDITPPTAPGTPQWRSGDERDGSFDLTWTASVDTGSGIKLYEVYRQIGSGSWSLLGTATSPTYTVPYSPPGTYHFRVRAQDNAGNWGAYSGTSAAVIIPWDMRVTTQVAVSATPSIIADSRGNYHVVWVDARDGNNEIYYKELDRDWNVVVSDTRLTNNPYNSTSPAIVAYRPLASGDFLTVVWSDNRDGNYEIYRKTYTPGAGWGLDTRMTTSPDDSKEPRVVADSAFNLYYVWREVLRSKTGEKETIWYSKNGVSPTVIYTLNGAANTRTHNDRLASPDVAIGLPGPIVHVVFSKGPAYPVETGTAYLYYLRNSGGKWSAVQQLGTELDRPRQISVAADSANRVYVAWEAGGGVGKNFKAYGVSVRTSDTAGNSWNAEQALATSSLYKRLHPDIASVGSKVYVTWSSNDAGQQEVYYVVSGACATPGSWGLATALTNAQGDSINPAIAVSPMTGVPGFVWQDYRDLNWEIYFASKAV